MIGFQGYEHAIRWVERRIAPALNSPGSANVTEPQAALDLARDDLLAILAKYGPQRRTFLDLGRCAMGTGNYADAVGYFRRAESPQMERSAAQRRDIVQWLDGAFGSGRKTLTVTPLSRGRWIALSAVRREQRDPPSKWPPIATEIRIHLVEKDSEKLRVVQTRNVCLPDWESNENTAFLIDLDGDGKPELVVWSVFYGATVLPIKATVFKLGAKLQKAGMVSGAEGLWLSRPRKSDSPQFTVQYAYGENYDRLSHAEQPRWTDAFVMRNGRLQNVTSERADLLRQNRQELLKAVQILHGEPDVEIRLHQAYLCALTGNHEGWRMSIELAKRDAKRGYRDWMRFSAGSEASRQQARDRYREDLNLIRLAVKRDYP